MPSSAGRTCLTLLLSCPSVQDSSDRHQEGEGCTTAGFWGRCGTSELVAGQRLAVTVGSSRNAPCCSGLVLNSHLSSDEVFYSLLSPNTAHQQSPSPPAVRGKVLPLL